MGSEDLRKRITEQFSYRGERADIWRAFDALLETDAFLNLGYSEWYQPHVLGSCQRRLVTEVGRTLTAALPRGRGVRLLDVGCGRGGPAVHLADRFGFDVTGIDLVPYNVARARQTARKNDVDAQFMIGDATRLPVGPGAVGACTAVDALVYLSDRETVFEALADALEANGVLVLSDLVARSPLPERDRQALGRFATAWDMPMPGTTPEYVTALEAAGFDVLDVTDISPHSVRRFRKWTTLFLWLQATPLRSIPNALLSRRGIDAATVHTQVRRAHDALPALRHVLLVARR
jgi:MPBQ/MSBQ methyltransferase